MQDRDSTTSVRGEAEASALNASKRECYAATSSSFLRSHGHDSGRSPAADLERLARGEPRPRWPNRASFGVCLTHDVDGVSLFDTRMHFRKVASQLRYFSQGGHDRRAFRGLRSGVAALVRAAATRRRDDPLHQYERWLHMEAEVGARSTFLFLPDAYGRAHYSDAGYRHADVVRFDGQRCTVAEMMREIHHRGWEVGVHGSWHTCNSADALKREKEQVERAIDSPVVSARQHNLHFDIRRTPRVYRDAGIQVDSSLGFNDDIGFRAETCYPFPLHDFASRDSLDVWELPLIVQDKCLVKHVAKGDEEAAVAAGVSIAKQVRSVGGVLTLLWHPETIAVPIYCRVYERLLRELQQMGAWFGTMAEVARHCRGANENRPREAA